MKQFLFYLIIIGLPFGFLGLIVMLNYIGKLIYG